MLRVAIVLGQLPERVWQNVDYEDLIPLLNEHAVLNGADAQQNDSGIEPANDYDIEQIKRFKAKEAAKT